MPCRQCFLQKTGLRHFILTKRGVFRYVLASCAAIRTIDITYFLRTCAMISLSTKDTNRKIVFVDIGFHMHVTALRTILHLFVILESTSITKQHFERIYDRQGPATPPLWSVLSATRGAYRWMLGTRQCHRMEYPRGSGVFFGGHREKQKSCTCVRNTVRCLCVFSIYVSIEKKKQPCFIRCEYFLW